MDLLLRLFMPRRRKNQQEVAGRAQEVVRQVLFDIGIDRFVNGIVVLDRQFRLRFRSALPPSCFDFLAVVAVRDLPEAVILRAYVGPDGVDAGAVSRHAPLLAEGVMRELLAQSIELRALPLRHDQRERRSRAR